LKFATDGTYVYVWNVPGITILKHSCSLCLQEFKIFVFKLSSYEDNTWTYFSW